ncbi:MAG TPA: hypothetical protein ENJ77_00075 [Candidatus Moranbacteria bacterium]|nr:hypothetical protein [Candidatus Moranbacteria bacterium]
MKTTKIISIVLLSVAAWLVFSDLARQGKLDGVFSAPSPSPDTPASVGKRDLSGLPTVSEGKPLVLAPGSGFNGPGYTRQIRVIPPRDKTCGLTYRGCVDVHFLVKCRPEDENLSYCKKKVGLVVRVVKTMCGPAGKRVDNEKLFFPTKNSGPVHSKRVAYGRIIQYPGGKTLEELAIDRETVISIAANAPLIPEAAGANTVNRENPVQISLNYCH